MAQLKTTPSDDSVMDFIEKVENVEKRQDCYTILKLMKEITGEEPRMWGPSIVGFGSYHYRYDSGREGDWFLTGFSPRKQNLTVYIMSGFNQYDGLMKNLGKYKTGSSCLYLKKLQDVDDEMLKELITRSVKDLKNCYPQVP